MSKRKHCDTSADALASIKSEDMKRLYRRIIEALKILGQGSSQQIAAYLTLEDDVVRKRLSELERFGIIYKPGHKVPTKKGRDSYVWQLCSAGAKTDLQNKVMAGKTIQDYSRTIQSIEQNLF
jgi:predicted ArsR family transcriptional regulator